MSRASGWGSSASALQPLGVAHEAGVAPQRGAGLGARAVRARAPSAARRGRAARLGHGRQRGARPEDEALGQRVGGQPVGAVQAGARALADGVEARAPSWRRRGRRRSRPCRSAPPAPPARARWPGPGPPRAARRRRWGTAAGRPRACRGRRSAARSRSSSTTSRAPPRRAARARRRSARRAASSSVAPSPRIASVTRKPSRPLMPVTAVGWNCMSSRSASAAPAPRASSRPMPSEPGGLVVRCHSAAEPPGGEDDRAGVDRAPVLADDAHAAPVADPERGGAGAFDDGHARRLDDDGGQLAHDAPAGRAAAGVHDAPARVAALQAEREVAVAVGVEVHAEALEVAARSRGASRQRTVAALVRTRSRPARSVSSRCRSGESSARQRRRQPALRPVARGARQRRGGHERDARARRGPR